MLTCFVSSVGTHLWKPNLQICIKNFKRVFFIPATTANDLRLWRIFYHRFYPLQLFSYLNSWERASIFPFECSVLNKGTSGTIFISLWYDAMYYIWYTCRYTHSDWQNTEDFSYEGKSNTRFTYICPWYLRNHQFYHLKKNEEF